MENVKISIPGRHDPCIVLRAVPVVEAAAALAILDAMMEPAQAYDTDLSACRAKIDGIDAQMLRLFEERMKTAAEIAEIKKEHGLPVFDAAREQEILQEVCGKLPDGLQDYGKKLFETLMDISKDYQKNRMEEDGTC
jgi:monofunctional chorismate mutase